MSMYTASSRWMMGRQEGNGIWWKSKVVVQQHQRLFHTIKAAQKLAVANVRIEARLTKFSELEGHEGSSVDFSADEKM